ncbi:MAG: extracellular solute-binding protein [Reyranella sp.]|uniref:extracellular solute-binding protein n=1 Tax=Reyranella sp. TaxID=1929291 RepID=UPI002731B03C|nr:extracellular solute-binding protein [Reyranella sp.]MDP1965613.1 extracellular solute-binding protein [Reyranella sp.]MDP2374647.1 extracellular solute-binding protein [Reyranella sp.]
MFSRRSLLAGATALGGTSLLPSLAHAKGIVTAATYPGSWEEAYRAVVAPALKKAYDVDLELQPLFAVDQIAKVRAARGAPPFDAFVLDPGPRITGIEGGLFEKFDGKKISNAPNLPAGMIDQWGICVGAQVVGIGYNPKKLPKPTGWKDLLSDPWVSRLGITGFQTTFGTVSLIEIAKAFGGSETNVEPAFVELKKVLPKIAAVGNPAAMPGLLQQGQCDITYTNIQTVAILKSRGVDIEFVKPASGAVAFFTTMHIAKGAAEADNAYKYFDTVVSKAVGDALVQPPHNFIPVNKQVVLPPSLPMTSLDEMSTYIQHDWSKINPLRAGWIEKFNKEMAK